MEKGSYFLVGVLLTFVLNMFLRWLRKEKDMEEYSLKAKMLEVRDGLSKQNLDYREFDDLDSFFRIRRTQENSIEDKIRIELKDSDTDPTEFMSQSEMNLYACNRAEEMDLKLESLITKLHKKLDSKERDYFDLMHSNWKIYRSSQADFYSSAFEGGTMKQFLYSSEISNLTIERIAYVQVELDSRYELLND